jgi:hypothetical protein
MKKRIIITLCGLLFLFVGYQIYLAFYPSDSFYKKEFKDITKTEFPKSGKILFKTASYPDIHGAYCSCAWIEVSRTDFEELLNEIRKSGRNDTQFIYSDSWEKLETKIGNKIDYEIKSSELNNKNEFRFWGLLKDGKSIVIYKGNS